MKPGLHAAIDRSVEVVKEDASKADWPCRINKNENPVQTRKINRSIGLKFQAFVSEAPTLEESFLASSLIRKPPAGFKKGTDSE